MNVVDNTQNNKTTKQKIPSVTILLFIYKLIANVNGLGETHSGGSAGESKSTLVTKQSDTKYVVDYFYINSSVTLPNPYPLEKCVLYDYKSQLYAYYTCTANNAATRSLYKDSSCLNNFTTTTSITSTSINDGDMYTSNCEATNSYYSVIQIGCSGSLYLTSVPGVCFRDSLSTLKSDFNNEFICGSSGTTLELELWTGAICTGTATTTSTFATCGTLWSSLVTDGQQINGIYEYATSDCYLGSPAFRITLSPFHILFYLIVGVVSIVISL